MINCLSLHDLPFLNCKFLFQAGIGEAYCFISDTGHKTLFLFQLPILILMLFNIYFFMIFIIKHIQSQIATKEATFSRVSCRNQPSSSTTPGTNNTLTELKVKQGQAVLYMKLFFVLGIFWILENVQFIIRSYNGNHTGALEIFFTVIDCCNMLRGFFLFLIFICKRRVKVKIKRFLFCHFKGNIFSELPLSDLSGQNNIYSASDLSCRGIRTDNSDWHHDAAMGLVEVEGRGGRSSKGSRGSRSSNKGSQGSSKRSQGSSRSSDKERQGSEGGRDGVEDAVIPPVQIGNI